MKIKEKMTNRKLMILTGYRHPSVGLYTPKKNKKKLGLFAGLFGISFVVPCMTTAVTISLKLITKYNPLWLYK